ncbi:MULTISPECIES: carboxymuconolactone decarboxylase family protein [unclassified Thioalkalivibrio]|uniref:carboxymuconolactone decarboxylase family protein n=1 Tax=unclassified Thioalkalivibrio TaxID=2621013 RepID=UPI00037A3EA0|nr:MULTISPECIES: carboxymuconolactone decarboxylase family protein [unclassified Thioalkalivibrio]
MTMEFPLRTPGSAPEAFERSGKVLGLVPNLIRVMASSPAAASAYLDLTERLSQSSLSPEEQSVALLTISRFHECHYCMAAHSMTGRMAGLPDAVVDALREDQPVPDQRLEALRRFVVAVLEHRGAVPDAELEAFRRAGFDEAAILDVILAVALKTLSNYTNHLAATPLDDVMQDEHWEAPAGR